MSACTLLACSAPLAPLEEQAGIPPTTPTPGWAGRQCPPLLLSPGRDLVSTALNQPHVHLMAWVTPTQGTSEFQLSAPAACTASQCIPVHPTSHPGLPQLSSSWPSPAPMADEAEPGKGALLDPEASTAPRPQPCQRAGLCCTCHGTARGPAAGGQGQELAAVPHRRQGSSVPRWK